MQKAVDPRLIPLRDALVGKVLAGSGHVSYHLRECIGEGGQGWVFRANWDDPSGHVVIVKVLRPDVVATEALRRFHREAEVLRMLSTHARPNPYIVRFFDHAVAQIPSPFGSEPLALPFTVLEYVDGTTLERVLRSSETKRGLPAERARRVLRQIAQALDVVHAQKVVHRDLKPSNILLATEAGTEIAKVTDFGLVKLVDVNLQRTATLAGASLGYAPPEQYEKGNERVSPRTDIFSLAAVAYEMLSGKPAFPFVEGENPLLIVTRILNAARPSLMRVRDSLAPELESAPSLVEALDREFARALAADPAARHASVMEFWKAIEPALRTAAEEKRPSRPASSRWTTAPLENAARPAARRGATPLPPAQAVPTPGTPATPPPPSPASPASPRGARAPAPRDVSEAVASNPASWTWSVLTGTLAPSALRCAVFRSDGEGAVAITAGGIARWERGGWTKHALPSRIPGAAVRGLRACADGSVLVFGEGGLVARIVLGGDASVWSVPDAEITFLGALVEASGTTTLVGERPYRGGARRSVPGTTAGVVAQFSGERVTLVSDAINCTRLRGVARVASGALVACGDWGAVERIELGVVEHIGAVCGGHLTAISALPEGGGVTVGVGGHALSLSSSLEAQLEPVQTTRDLLCVTTTDDGQAWAGSAQARILRRARVGNVGWVRMSGDIGVSPSIIGLWARDRCVRAIGDDGAVVEGRLACA